MTLKRSFDFALYIAIGLCLAAFLYWVSISSFDLESRPVWPHVAFMSGIAFASQVEIRRLLHVSFGLTFWISLSVLTLLAVIPVHYAVAKIQPWPGIYSVAAGAVEAVVFLLVLDRVAPGRPRKPARGD